MKAVNCIKKLVNQKKEFLNLKKNLSIFLFDWNSILLFSYLNISAERQDENICCIIGNEGIRREISIQNKSKGTGAPHEWKGMCLTQNRLDSHNALNEGDAGRDYR